MINPNEPEGRSMDLEKELSDIKRRLEGLEARILTISRLADELDNRTISSIRIGGSR